jgi:hypothetical protein
MKKTFLIATVDNRIAGCKALVESLKRYSDVDWGTVIVAQGYSQEQRDDMTKFISQYKGVEIIYVDDYIGAGSAKIMGLQHTRSGIWCSLDDDMLCLERTNYDEMAHILVSRNDIGILVSNWAKTEELCYKKQIRDEIIRQHIVYTGGGLMFRGDVAELLLTKCEDKEWLFDDVQWSMTCYVNGYVNGRYLGSVAKHSVCSVGGRKEWVRQKHRELPDFSLINIRRAFNDKVQAEHDNCYCICLSSDLTDKSHELHKLNRRSQYEKISTNIRTD